jgi:hypothetical protein
MVNAAVYGYLPNSSLIGNIVFQQNGQTVMTTTKTYDSLNRLTFTESTGGSGAPPLPSFNYSPTTMPTNARQFSFTVPALAGKSVRSRSKATERASLGMLRVGGQGRVGLPAEAQSEGGGPGLLSRRYLSHNISLSCRLLIIPGRGSAGRDQSGQKPSASGVRSGTPRNFSLKDLTLAGKRLNLGRHNQTRKALVVAKERLNFD